MKKLIWTLAIITLTLWVPARSLAEKVEQDQAARIAKNFYNRQHRQNLALTYTHTKNVQRFNTQLRSTAAADDPMYYVFDYQTGGFVIVAGDDVAQPILGYSDEGNFDINNQALAYWLETIAEQIADAINNNTQQNNVTKNAWVQAATNQSPQLRVAGDYVDPIVKTKWNQDYPFNILCPKISGTIPPAGCVATTMAQIMKHYNYPAVSSSIPAYTSNAHKINVPGNSPVSFDWIHMTNSYNNSSSTVENNAVAQLVYLCGVSVQMDYMPSASGAFSQNVPNALKFYFGYDQAMDYLARNFYSHNDWIEIIKTELKNNRPVYYDGQGTHGGHAFVCDGYDTNDLFHINWGWGGSSDGFFVLSALDPYTLGIGGGSGGFNNSQGIIVGIQPNNGGTNPDVQIGYDFVEPSKSQLNSRSETFNLTLYNLQNRGAQSVNVNLGLLLFDPDGHLIQTYIPPLSTPASASLILGQRFDTYSLPAGASYALPDDITNGDYKLYPAYRTSTTGDFNILTSSNGERFIAVNVSAHIVTLSTDGAKPQLTLLSLTANGNVYRYQTSTYNARISNNGYTDYNAKMELKLDGQSITQVPVVIPALSTHTLTLAGIVTAEVKDNRELTLLYEENNLQYNEPTTPLGNPTLVRVQPNPGTFNVSCQQFAFDDPNNVHQNRPQLNATIHNDAGFFEGEVCTFILNPLNTVLGSFSAQQVLIDAGQTQQVTFDDNIQDVTSINTDYKAVLCYKTSSSWISFGDTIHFTAKSPAYSNDATLQSITVKKPDGNVSYALNEKFSPAQLSYSVNVGNNVEYISILPVGTHPRAKFNHFENYQLNTGSNNFSVSVTAENKVYETTYHVNVIKAGPLSPQPGNNGLLQNSRITTQSADIQWTLASSTLQPLTYSVYLSQDHIISTVATCETYGLLVNGTGYEDINSITINELIPNTTYFVNVVVQDPTGLKTAYATTSFTTQQATLTGSIHIEGITQLGETLTVNTENLTSIPVVPADNIQYGYQWIRTDDNVIVGTADTYFTQIADIGKQLQVLVTAQGLVGTVVSPLSDVITKAIPTVPDAPTVSQASPTSITLHHSDINALYQCNEGNWQSNPHFNHLIPNTTYTFKTKFDDSDTHQSSDVSSVIEAATQPAIITITDQPNDSVFVKAGDETQLTVNASVTQGANIETYQWFRIEQHDTIRFDNNNTLSLASDLPVGAYYYVCEVTASHGATPVHSSTVVAIVKETTNAAQPIIAVQPTDSVFVTAGGTISTPLTAEASSPDNGILSYQWFANNVYSSVNGTSISGANSNSFTPENADSTTYYYVQITNTNNTVDGQQSISIVSQISTVIIQYSVGVNATTSTCGTVEAQPTLATAGENISLSITPNKGFELDQIVAHKDGDPTTTVTLYGNRLDRAFTMPAFNVIADATFKKNSQQIAVENAQKIIDATAAFDVNQAYADNIEQLKNRIAYEINNLVGFSSTGITVYSKHITVSYFQPATAGTSSKVYGTEGSFTFTVELELPNSTSVTTNGKTGKIVPTPYHNISTQLFHIAPMAHGSVVVQQGNSVAAGDSVTLLIRPDSGYELYAITVYKNGQSGMAVKTVANSDSTRILEMPAFDVIVAAAFKLTTLGASVNEAKNSIENLSLNVEQATANEKNMVISWTLQQIMTALPHLAENTGIDPIAIGHLEIQSFVQAVQASRNNPNGTAGLAQINVALAKGNVHMTARLNVAIIPTPVSIVTYTITTIPSTTGFLQIDKTDAAPGEKVTVHVAVVSGYELVQVHVVTKNNNTPITLASEGAAYAFLMPEADVNVSAEFKASAPNNILLHGDAQTTVYATHYGIKIVNATINDPVKVYSLQGNLLFNTIAGQSEINIPVSKHGLHIVIVGGKSYKVMVY